jgi:hypothetical protein
LEAERVFISTVTDILNRCLRTGHNPEHSLSPIAVTLRKAGPRDYYLLKSHRPFTLLNAIDKPRSDLSDDNAGVVEEDRLLPDTQCSMCLPCH